MSIRMLVAATLAAFFFSVPSNAPGAASCAREFSPTQYERYASKVYDRATVSRAARSKLRRMTLCSTSVRRTRAIRTRLLRNRCTQSKPVNCIALASRRYRVSFTMLKRKAWCESRHNPHASNGAHTGLFQFRTAAPSTWATTPYARRNPRVARWNALAAGWMHSVGRGGEWTCQ